MRSRLDQFTFLSLGYLVAIYFVFLFLLFLHCGFFIIKCAINKSLMVSLGFKKKIQEFYKIKYRPIAIESTRWGKGEDKDQTIWKAPIFFIENQVVILKLRTKSYRMIYLFQPCHFSLTYLKIYRVALDLKRLRKLMMNRHMKGNLTYLVRSFKYIVDNLRNSIFICIF